MGIFLDWLNITVTTTFELLWYLIVSPPPRTPPNQVADGPAPAPPPRPQAQGSASEQSKYSIPRLFALVIGIDKYACQCNLAGAVADAEAVSDFLQKTLLVPKDQIKILRNEEATRLTIEAAIEALGNDTAIEKDDPILIFYAGHGAEAKAPPGWSESEKIQMLAPHDFKISGSDDLEGGQGVLDARLSRLLQDIADKKSDNITVILDSCHSGSGTRTGDNDPTCVVRRIELPESYVIPAGLLQGIEAPRRGTANVKGEENAGLLSHVILSACKAEQLAREEGKRGVFTQELLKVLQEHGVDKLTYNEVIAYMEDMSGQDPQCEGAHRSRCLFDSKVASPHREIYSIRNPQPSQSSQSSQPGGVTSANSNSATPKQYILEAGEAQGITKNAEFAVYRERTMAPDSALGTVVAVNITAFETTCDISPRDGKTQPFTDFKSGFASQTRVGDGQNFRLFIDLTQEFLPVFTQIAEKMRSTEPEKRAFSLADSRNDRPDLVVGLTADRKRVCFEITENDCRSHGLTRMPFEVEINDSNKIYRILRSSADFYWHLHRSSQKGPLAAVITLECRRLKRSGRYKGLKEILEPYGKNLNEQGVISVDDDTEAMYGFQITNTDPEIEEPLYVSMFYFGASDLSIVLYYEPGIAKRAVSPSLSYGQPLTVGYGTSGTAPQWYAPSEGQDIDVGFLKLFVTTKYVDLSGIAQKSPFKESRNTNNVLVPIQDQFYTMCVPIVQKRKKKEGEGISEH